MAITNPGSYNTLVDYPNASGIYKILYPLRDSIPIANPFFIILFGFLLVATVSSYNVYISLTGRARFFNCLLSSSFATFIISIFFAMGKLVDAYTPLLFIGITIITLALAIFYK